MITLNVVSAIGLALLFVCIGVGIERCTGAPSTEPRTCNACGHERGWHTTWRPAGYPWGCKHPPDRPGQTGLWCSCPAGRRSIR